jgi:hypothetical protein
MTHHIKYHNEGEWVREAAIVYEQKLKEAEQVINMN